MLLIENLTVSTVPLALLLRGLGARPRYIRISQKLADSARFRRLLSLTGIVKALEEDLPYPTQVACHYDAIQLVEPVFERQTANRALAQAFAGGLHSDKALLAYKKVLLAELHQFCRVRATLDAIDHLLHPKRIAFVPEDFLHLRRSLEAAGKSSAAAVPPTFEVPFWAALYSAVARVALKGAWLGAYVLFPLFILSKVRRVSLRPPARKNYQVGLRVYNDDLAFHSSYRRVDFLLDGKTLHKGNVLFCIDTPLDAAYRNGLEARSYATADLPRILHSVSLGFLKEVMLGDFIRLWLGLNAAVWTADPFSIKTSLKSLLTFVRWRRFLQEFSVGHYVVVNDSVDQHIIRNIILNRSGALTYYYVHSRNSDDVFAPEAEFSRYVCILFSYLSYDHFIRWSRNNGNYYKPHAIGEFVNIGTLWSEHIREIIGRPDFAQLRKSYQNKAKAVAGKIVSVFDTTFGFGDGIVLQPDDIAPFADDIHHLLEDFPDIMVIFKQKTFRADIASQKVLDSYDRLAAHERCYFVPMYTDAAEMIAVADFSITACFSSTTLEALGARKKAIYHDATAKLRGTYYDKFPRLVSHDYPALRALTKHYLYDTSDAQFERWIEDVVVDEIDAFADGRGITRFRELLTRAGVGLPQMELGRHR